MSFRRRDGSLPKRSKSRRWLRLVVLTATMCLYSISRSAAGNPDAGLPTPAANVKPTPSQENIARSVAERLQKFRASTSAVKSVRVLPIDGTIEPGLASFIQRSLEDTDEHTLVVFSIKTFGGRVDAAVRIRDAILEARAPTLAFVDRRAISAGALIALAADLIVMSPGASIGAATPVQQGAGGKMEATSEKVVSYMRAEMRSTAEATGRPALLAEAMVDEDIAIQDVTAEGKLLTLTGSEAVNLGVADSLAENPNEALATLGLGELSVQRFEINWAERIARFVTDPLVSSLLMSLGFIGLLMELYSPGFGVGGAIGISCLLLFFGGQYLGHLAGWEELLLFAIGLALLALEVFLIPGFGIAGIAGIVAILASLIMALVSVDLPWEVARELGYVQEALSRAVIQLAAVFVIVGVAGVVMAKKLPKSRFGSWLVFKPSPAVPGSSAGLGAEAHGGSLPVRSDLLGKQGTTASVLRPSGIVEFDHERVHVVTEGEFIDADETVKVVAVEGHRIVVKKA